MNNTTIINTFNGNNSNAANFKLQHRQIMTTIANKILKFKPMTKIPIVTSHNYFAIITFSRVHSFIYINSMVTQNS